MKDCFCASACVDFLCSFVSSELNGESDTDCKDCWLNTGECEDCFLQGSSIFCPLEVKKSRE